MRKTSRALAGSLVLGMALTACGGGGGTGVIPSSGSAGSGADTHPQIKHVIAAVPRPAGQLSATDAGKIGDNTPVHITVSLNYNNQAQLDQLVADQANPLSPMYHHYLSTSEFNARFAPTQAQQDQVEATLRSEGFTIAHDYANHTLIDAVAPAAVVQHTFNTEIHAMNQGKFGTRYANVKTATLPQAMTSLVHDITMNNLVVMHRLSTPSGRSQTPRSISPPPNSLHARSMASTYTSNVVTNAGFESGGVNNGWLQCGNINAAVVTTHPHSGSYDERSGNGTSEPNGDTGVCQAVTIPSNGTLSFWVYQRSNEVDTTYAWQEADLLDQYGDVVDNFYYSVNNTNGWVQKSYNVGAYAGGTYYLYFGVHGDGYGGAYTQQFVDDVNLSNGTSTPTPSPTATPTQAPTPTPTVKPTATPTNAPTPTPTVKPTATPTTAPTPTPVPTSTPGSACTGSAALNGPSTESSSGGWLATGVAKAFDYPVQHGCNGAGQTVAVEIDTPIITSDVQTYLSKAGVSESGTITNVAVDGGGNSSSSDYVETALDVETIAGLAPGANIRVYNFPDLSSQSIEDGYNQAVSDGLASVVNSSFGGCETSDTSFTNTTNTIAEQAAAKGITFAASSGDSGSNECGSNNNALGVSSPSSDPYFMSIGSVDFTANSNGSLASIKAGVDSSNGFSSGGGYSTVFAVPSYQSGISGVNSKGRNNPDVSLPGVHVAVYASGQGGWMAVDGTSWSSPEFVALMAEVNQARSTHYGFVNPNIYTLFKNAGYADYTDVTSGSNGAYSAVSGYDLVTGIGAPKGWSMTNAL